ncbi:ABC-type amino acid transport/signal transduction systems, periplasmic component/domain [Desulfamplus magnetovallimortis]|uniref:ABC-type amino acid transport/signal transduction systems, periplasmic component/domain n=1 Tax=Desulfamplus magnetovallimortis TaxID=1246637 RepID=A0A1W1HJ55_9BACT|nr:transporter substrate-binding domain-containing protein [Desulfamplus magnetovallimortis]SLM32445.1 ABC-type amino acid transport/signal transduction systems, periplasmic component/domain [Desulfamplus magnetovallimortis]
MKRIVLGVMVFCTMVCIASSSLWANDKLVLATLEWEPYIGPNLKDHGYVAVIVKEAFKRGGYDIEYDFMQWSRVIGLAKAGRVDGYFPEYYSDELKENNLISSPFPGGPLGFFKRKGDDISYKTLNDLTGNKIGVVMGYVNTVEFDAADFLTKDESPSDLVNLKKLLANRIRLMVADKFVGLNLLQQNMPDKINEVEFVEPPLEVKDLYVCIPKNRANAEKIHAAFDKGLAEMNADGTIEKILKDYGF